MLERLTIFSPISIFFIHGSPCCPSMNWDESLQIFLGSPNCFLSPKIEEANVCLIFGTISKPLANLIEKAILRMPKKRVIVHFLGCRNSAPNYLALDSSCSLSFSLCNIDEKTRNRCLEGIYLCLKA